MVLFRWGVLCAVCSLGGIFGGALVHIYTRPGDYINDAPVPPIFYCAQYTFYTCARVLDYLV